MIHSVFNMIQKWLNLLRYQKPIMKIKMVSDTPLIHIVELTIISKVFLNKIKTLLVKNSEKMGNDLWIIPLKYLTKVEASKLIEALLKNDIYDFTVSKIGTEEWYDYYYGKN